MANNKKQLPYEIEVVMKHVRRERLDISNFLWHFIRSDGPPRDVLLKILEGQCLKGNACPPSGDPVICFTEAPLSTCLAVAPFLLDAQYPRLSSGYALGFKKEFLYSKGARPVIYQSREEFKDLPKGLQWRHVDLDLTGEDIFDYTWQREWRLREKQFFFDVTDALVLVPDVTDFEGVLWEYDVDVESEGDGEVSYQVIQAPLWPCIVASDVTLDPIRDEEIEMYMFPGNEDMQEDVPDSTVTGHEVPVQTQKQGVHGQPTA